MVRVFCGRRGAGKTKNLIKLANDKVLRAKGDSVYIDCEKRAMLELDKSIRFITTEDLNLQYYDNIYGFICGLISQNYDIENIYIDGVIEIIPSEILAITNLLRRLEVLTAKFNINIYININADESTNVIEILKDYVA